jgi:hypothetical protein
MMKWEAKYIQKMIERQNIATFETTKSGSPSTASLDLYNGDDDDDDDNKDDSDMMIKVMIIMMITMVMMVMMMVIMMVMIKMMVIKCVWITINGKLRPIYMNKLKLEIDLKT